MTHIAMIPGTKSVDLECQTRMHQVVSKIEASIETLERALESNRRQLDDIIASRDGVSFDCESVRDGSALSSTWSFHKAFKDKS